MASFTVRLRPCSSVPLIAFIAAVAETMIEEALAAADALQEGQVVEIYRWVRELALRIALRALLGIEATEGRERRLAAAFETAERRID